VYDVRWRKRERKHGGGCGSSGSRTDPGLYPTDPGPRDAIFRDAISHDIIFCDVISCDVISRDAISCDVTPSLRDVIPYGTPRPLRDNDANYRFVYPRVRTGPLYLLIDILKTCWKLLGSIFTT